MFFLKTKNLKLKTDNGFTLLEVLLSISIISIVFGFSVPIYYSFQVRNDLDVARFALIQNLHRAQSLSQMGEGDSSWGVYIASDKITLFKGSSFATRDINFDEDFSISSSGISGLQEIIFNKFNGLPQMTGTTTITSTTNETKQIAINEKGTISY
ncbi:hypothetical protein A3I18_00695 [Candidatus Campbellbacteria bacterium RIFCSPLOWO2_02_FULL_35_11]|uniref:General secretion pathway GspH domain-containing protein n=2 Tax=Candidatus Campbelliibacteriota TaxID=1752727 RepID=A0A1F5ENQ8_9BACT|nr:MAG: hypothetical protein A3E89_01245 [Candidatus Campbellbacteria bacterium RIFCSPHIGHO2_12_FULL_35_10]OGD69901.1 MAG: hypothetical protein A3I18_00695 [Candidatus Campbellbacteria bacterium RIFCSPLOWO2_02_FULL_35_11]